MEATLGVEGHNKAWRAPDWSQVAFHWCAMGAFVFLAFALFCEEGQRLDNSATADGRTSGSAAGAGLAWASVGLFALSGLLGVYHLTLLPHGKTGPYMLRVSCLAALIFAAALFAGGVARTSQAASEDKAAGSEVRILFAAAGGIGGGALFGSLVGAGFESFGK